MNVDKKKLLNFIITQLEAELPELIAAAQATYEAATHEESKPENEYDTRGLEASYLAGAQAKRVAEIEERLHVYKHLALKIFLPTDTIAATAIVQVENEDKKSMFFLMPKGGGQVVNFEGQTIQVITPSSPLGESLLGLKVGDSATVEKANETREYEILAIC